MLTRAVDVHSLSEAEARRAYPVHLEAVVTFYNPMGRNWSCRTTPTASTSGLETSRHRTCALASVSSIDGFSGPGDFAPIIVQPRIRVLGDGPLPDPLILNTDEVLLGTADCRWVEVRGVVSSVRPFEGSAYLTLGSGAHRYEVYIARQHQEPRDLLHTRIRARGVLLPKFNRKRQLTGVGIRVPEIRFVTVEGRAAHADGT